MFLWSEFLWASLDSGQKTKSKLLISRTAGLWGRVLDGKDIGVKNLPPGKKRVASSSRGFGGKSSWKMKPIMALMGVTLLYFLPANFAEVSRGGQELGRPIFIDKEPYQAISNNPKFKRSSEISSLLQR
ncbi:Uncharacterized protein Rs2_49812 [Raphanus sativus]|nr:Uncharacterized protein Rs2_49812 [Raphanus sativus]